MVLVILTCACIPLAILAEAHAPMALTVWTALMLGYAGGRLEREVWRLL